MTFEEIQQRLTARFGERIGPLAPANKDAFLLVKPPDLVEICRFLKDEPDLAFDCLMNLSAVDWPKKNQIEIVYHLFSYQKRHSFILKAQLDRAAPEIASLEPVWKAADWLEREQYDLMGVQFTGHPDLRRIMMPDDWIGHPLRKDYKEPAQWHNITTTRDNSLEGYVRLDELKKKAAEAANAGSGATAPAGAPQAPAPKKEALS
ncbi:MAG TPA: NADH-quinone oxidoreductase subunit C [Myxococcales bacterium]|nr:NADH-quinone oxidoreductase subunit C [Myxococcales bacterium]